MKEVLFVSLGKRRFSVCDCSWTGFTGIDMPPLVEDVDRESMIFFSLGPHGVTKNLYFSCVCDFSPIYCTHYGVNVVCRLQGH